MLPLASPRDPAPQSESAQAMVLQSDDRVQGVRFPSVWFEHYQQEMNDDSGVQVQAMELSAT